MTNASGVTPRGAAGRDDGALRVGIAYDLRSDFAAHADGPDDRLEEYDSESTVAAIVEGLSANGYQPELLGGGRRLMEKVMARPPDLVFNLAEGFGTRAREAHVPAVLEMLGVPFTHSDPVTLGVTLDKAMAKRLVAGMGVATPRFAVLTRPEQVASLDLTFPVIAKPLFEGSSMGIRKTSRVDDRQALGELVSGLLRGYGQAVLVEEFCNGPEFTVGIIGTGESARVLAVMEIVPKRATSDEFVYSVEVKRNYETEVEYQVPSQRPAQVLSAVEDLALRAYRALECRDVGRVDVRLDAQGQPYFIELNPLPGINPISSDLVIMTGRMGISYADLIGRIVQGARERYRI